MSLMPSSTGSYIPSGQGLHRFCSEAYDNTSYYMKFGKSNLELIQTGNRGKTVVAKNNTKQNKKTHLFGLCH